MTLFALDLLRAQRPLSQAGQGAALRQAGNAEAAIDAVTAELDHAITATRMLAGHLNEAHQAASGLATKTGDDFRFHQSPTE